MPARKLIPPFLVSAIVIIGVVMLAMTASRHLPATANSASSVGKESSEKNEKDGNPAACRGYVTLTFDDGPSTQTAELLRVLRQKSVKAAFFNTGQQTKKYPELVQQEVAEGHQLGNHSYSHPDLVTLSPPEIAKQVNETNALLRSHGSTTMFRPPYGSYDERVLKAAQQANLSLAMWTVDSKDFEQTSVTAIVERATTAKAGGNVLLHDGHALTVQALPQIIDTYRAQGLCTGLLAPRKKPQHPVESPALTFHLSAVANDKGSS